VNGSFRRHDGKPGSRERILDAAGRLFSHSPTVTLADVAAAAGVSRSTVYRHFADRNALLAGVRTTAVPADRPGDQEPALPPGRLARDRPVPVDAITAFDVVAPPALPQQIVAEAQRIAGVAVALYAIDIDGSHLLRIAGSERLPERVHAPLAVGPELDSDGLSRLRSNLSGLPGVEVVPLWLRGRATGVILTVGRPENSLAELARQAAAAMTLADRYTDAFAKATRRKRPTAAAEIQQGMLPPRISRITGGEVAGNVLPSYEVAGDWFDVIENTDGVWVTLANGTGSGTRSTASSAVALGALRASRRSDATPVEALTVMHRTLREMPGPREEMTAVVAHWDPVSHELRVTSCGHVPPLVVRADGAPRSLPPAGGRGLGGRSAPKPEERSLRLDPGERLIIVSDGVLADEEGKAGLGMDGLIGAVVSTEGATAADTVRRVHTAVLESTGGDLDDDATVVCLSVS
jgi:serine phosphatase RsbU (regulator of sigma subunit)